MHSHLARYVSEYSPSAVHEVHSVTVPPVDTVPAKQSPHSVSVVGVQALIMYLPVAQEAQVEQPAAPAPLVSPSPHSEHSSAPPVEYFPAGHCSSPLWSCVGLYPALAVMQTRALSVTEYLPSTLHSVHSVAAPPIDAVPARQSPHSVSAVGVQALIMYFPAAQVAQVEQPAAPALLVSPSPHSEHSLAPPVEYLPAGHCSSPLRSSVGLYPAFAV